MENCGKFLKWQYVKTEWTTFYLIKFYPLTLEWDILHLYIKRYILFLAAGRGHNMSASAVSTAATQQKFTALRKRLDQLGYRQPLGIESLPLVEKLFADLIHTTDSFKNSKLHQSTSVEDKSSIESYVEPYKSDNAKLVKENNDLHQQLIHTREDTEGTIKGNTPREGTPILGHGRQVPRRWLPILRFSIR